MKKLGLVLLAMVAMFIAGCGGGSSWIPTPAAKIYDAIGSGDADEVMRLVKSGNYNVNWPLRESNLPGWSWRNGEPLIQYAVEVGACNVLDALLSYDSDVDIYAEIGGVGIPGKFHTPRSLVYFVVRHGGRCLDVLIKHGMTGTDHVDADGYTFLHRAVAQGGHGVADTVRKLIEQGWDPNARDIINGNTPLHLVQSDDREIQVALINGGADRTLRNNDDQLATATGRELQRASDIEDKISEQRAREDEIRAEARREREAAERKRRSDRAIQQQLCNLDPNCTRVLPY